MAFIITYCKAGKHVYAYDDSRPKTESCIKHTIKAKIVPLKQKKSQIK